MLHNNHELYYLKESLIKEAAENPTESKDFYRGQISLLEGLLNGYVPVTYPTVTKRFKHAINRLALAMDMGELSMYNDPISVIVDKPNTQYWHTVFEQGKRVITEILQPKETLIESCEYTIEELIYVEQGFYSAYDGVYKHDETSVIHAYQKGYESIIECLKTLDNITDIPEQIYYVHHGRFATRYNPYLKRGRRLYIFNTN